MIGFEQTSQTWESMTNIFENSVPFHKSFGFKVVNLDSNSPELQLEMQEKLVGNFVRGNLHGGVISCTLDVIGGIVAFVDVVQRRQIQSLESMVEQFSRMGTIDLRVDYLRPGFGKKFIATGYALRTGNRVAVTRMELHNDEQKLIAVGTGAYIV